MKRKKILLVDDANTLLLVEGLILKKGPYDLVTARDGEEAIAKAAAERPDLILMDVLMPKMNGFKACERLRQMEETRTTPIIMVTARGEAGNREAGMKSGCNDFVTKPIDGVELLTKVRKYLNEP